MNESKSSRVRGSLLGGICADAMLAGFEGGILERGLWKLIGKTSQGRHRYTDDTAMNLDIMDEYLENGEIDQDRLARRFAGSYRWSRGYGPDAGRILKGIRRGVGWRDLNRKKFSDGSFGNGAAMRITPVAMISHFQNYPLEDLVVQVSEITHCHPVAIDSANLVSRIIIGILNGHSLPEPIHCACMSVETDELKSAAEVLAKHLDDPFPVSRFKEKFGVGVASFQSVPCAIAVAYSHSDARYSDLISACARIGGDADTIGSIAASIWGCLNGLDSDIVTGMVSVEAHEIIVRKVQDFEMRLCS